jgi:hypothetical protein
MKNNFKNKILVGLTAKHGKGWEKKLNEINKLKIKKIALFIEEIPIKIRPKLYKELKNSYIKSIPLVHIRQDTTKEEIKFLQKNFNSKYFTIHESGFKILNKWNGYHKELFLEMNYDNRIPSNVDVKKIGGFCIDLSHFKASVEKFSKEFEYTEKRKNIKKYFKCNHLNGYSYKKNCDLHYIKSLKNFDYLKTLPKFVFGKIIALEMYNSIAQQLRFKKYLIKILNRQFNK